MNERCQECGAPADVVLMETVNGVSQKIYLCRVCYFKKMNSIGMDDLLRKIFSEQDRQQLPEVFGAPDVAPGEVTVSAGRSDEESCPICGTTLAEYLKTNRLGCPQCYQAFAKKIEEDLLSIHGTTRHLHLVAAIPKNKQSLKEFKTLYDKALAAEDYDEAIRLREIIGNLTGTKKPAGTPKSPRGKGHAKR
ncbi:MAG: hypothetical protein K6B46_03205 [Opitutales bacterium]|nr:hypothetical protein [Opitutales bacterium]